MSEPAAPSRSHLLPPLLLTLTVSTGLVDAISYLALGHVFVANMTGNVGFLAFALAGARGLSVSASLTATAAFLVGAAIGGRAGVLFGAHRGRHLSLSTSASAALVLVALVVAGTEQSVPESLPVAARYTVTVLLALAMGLQNATARKLGVVDVTTTVLTLTLTGLAADLRFDGANAAATRRRIAAAVTMLLGAFAGAMALKVEMWLPLAVAAGLALLTGLLYLPAARRSAAAAAAEASGSQAG